MSDVYSQSTDAPHNPSNKTTIIIGVVVGGVSAIAITATVLFILIKKRKWDRLDQCEERLLDYQLARGYSKSRSTTPENQLYLSMISPSIQPNTRLASSPEVPPPAYQTLHPRYDPSRYSNVPIASSFDPRRASNVSTRGLSISIPSSEGSHSGVLFGHGASRSESSTWYIQQQQQQQQQQQPSSSSYSRQADWPLSTTPPDSNAARSSGSSEGVEDGDQREPRRPKPILSRLITNF